MLVGENSAAAVSGAWIGGLVALGARCRAYAATHSDTQLIVAITVPVRDFAAVLVASGWVLKGPAPELPAPGAFFRMAVPGETVRVVTAASVITDTFNGLAPTGGEDYVQVGASRWPLKAIRAASHASGAASRVSRPEPGNLATFAGWAADWDERLASQHRELVLAGTKKWLEKDLDSHLATEQGSDGGFRIRDVLMPGGESESSPARLLSAAEFERMGPAPGTACTVLDGANASTHAPNAGPGTIICILERSGRDDAAALELASHAQFRGEPLVPSRDLGWSVRGVEAMAFAVVP